MDIREQMTKTQYLYGEDVDPSKWATMPYKEVLKTKLQLADNVLSGIWEDDMLKRDIYRMNACYDAKKFNEDLLKELHE